MRLSISLWMVFSLTSCAVARPDIDLCIVNAPNGVRKCYNYQRDYNDDGSLKSSAKAFYRKNATVSDLNKAFVVDSPSGFEDGLASLKAYIRELRDHYQNCQNPTE